MMLSLARSNIVRKCRQLAVKSTRTMSSASADQEFDAVSWSEADLDKYLNGLGLPETSMAIITETDDAYEVRATNDKAEFDAHVVDFAVHNEFTDHEENRPYLEALGLDFKKKLTLGTAFALTALSNEVLFFLNVLYLCFEFFSWFTCLCAD